MRQESIHLILTEETKFAGKLAWRFSVFMSSLLKNRSNFVYVPAYEPQFYSH